MSRLGIHSPIGDWLDDLKGSEALAEVLAPSGLEPGGFAAARGIALSKIVRTGRGVITRPMVREMMRRIGEEQPSDAEFEYEAPALPYDAHAIAARLPQALQVGERPMQVAGPHGAVDLRVYTPGGPYSECLVWVHGGGFTSGDIDGPEAHGVAITLAAMGVCVVTVQYRKAVDGVTYPVPADDIYAAWTWAVCHQRELGIANAPHLGGASAGAALAAAVTVRVRDSREQIPASVLLAYPIVHPELPVGSDGLAAYGGSDFFTPEVVREMNLNYAGSAEVFQDPHAFAGVAELAGFPPTLIVNSERDSLRASGERFAAQLAAAGVSVVADFEPGTVHGHLSHPTLEPAQRSMARMAAWMTNEVDAHGATPR